ncbi:MAG: 6-phosphogluconolactonase [Acidobacteriota bacterium]
MPPRDRRNAPGEVRVFPDPQALAHAAAEEFARRTMAAVAAAGRCAVALSGGATPRLLFRELATASYHSLPWALVHLFWGDERCVPPDHPDSNYRTADEELASRIPIPPGHVHRMRGEDPLAERAAADYERELRSFFALARGELPRFDLVLLGLGGDGHTASLFPGTAAVGEQRRLAVANRVDALATWRLTLTLPVLNHAACVAFLVAGAGKAEILARVLDGPQTPHALPAQMVRPDDGTLLWFVDRLAAARLSGVTR